MTEIYWITRLTAIHDALEVAFAISTIVAVMSVIGYLIAIETPAIAKFIKKWLVYSSICSTLTGTAYVLTPTTSEALIIYATANAKEYYDTNEVLQGIPDKIIEYVDSVLSTKQ